MIGAVGSIIESANVGSGFGYTLQEVVARGGGKIDFVIEYSDSIWVSLGTSERDEHTDVPSLQVTRLNFMIPPVCPIQPSPLMVNHNAPGIAQR